MTPINTALLSFGMSGEVFHGPLLAAHAGFNLTHVVERTHTKATNRYPSVKVVRAVEEIWKNDSIELVVVNTPNETHYRYTEEALNAGKHVVVEKPFTVTAPEADKLIALARKKNKILTVFQNRRWDGDFLTIRKVVENQLLGKLVEAEIHYDRYRDYVEANTWKEEAKPGTGILYNLGSHMLDQVMMLFGMPKEVDARMGIQRPHGKVDDFYDIRLTYDTLQVIVKSSYLVREPGPRYILHGVGGSFVKYGLDPQEQALKEGKIPGTAGWGQEPKDFWGKINTSVGTLHLEGNIETLPGNYPAFYQNVYEAIRENKDLAVQPEQSRDVIRLIEACAESNHQRRAIKI
jgi:scyllo-inositol 2-dehydrogenase (NADP+)